MRCSFSCSHFRASFVRASKETMARPVSAASSASAYFLTSGPSGIRLLERNRGSRSRHYDPTATAGCDRAEPFRVNFGKGTRAVRSQPKTQQVTFAFRLRVILERSAIVQNGVIVYELNVARLQLHHQV